MLLSGAGQQSTDASVAVRRQGPHLHFDNLLVVEGAAVVHHLHGPALAAELVAADEGLLQVAQLGDHHLLVPTLLAHKARLPALAVAPLLSCALC